MSSSNNIPHTYSNRAEFAGASDWNAYFGALEPVEIGAGDLPYTILENVAVIFASGDGIINLPAGKDKSSVTVVNVGDGRLTLSPSGAETINDDVIEYVYSGESLQNVWSSTYGWRTK